MGWGLGQRHRGSLPIVAALLLGAAGGAAVMAIEIGDDPELVGGSLLGGCAAALAAYAPHALKRARRPNGRPSPGS